MKGSDLQTGHEGMNHLKSAQSHAPATPIVAGNDWSAIPSIPSFHGKVSVIVPAHCPQEDLNRCILALGQQEIPGGELEVVVVDHKSSPPLTAPQTSLDLRMDRWEVGHGPGAARRRGADLATGDILVFCDVDVLLDAGSLWEFARIPAACDYAVSLGFRQFVDPARVDTPSIEQALISGSAREYFASRKAAEGQEWIDEFLAKTDDNRIWRDDLWIVIVGAGMGVSRSLYQYAGGYRDFPFHGIEDTEFGWRLFQAGAVVVPNRGATGHHIGLRTISRDRERTTFLRAGTIANELPHKRFRLPSKGRQWRVPQVAVQMLVDDHVSVPVVVRTCNALLASEPADILVSIVVDSGYEDLDVLKSHFAGDAKVNFVSPEEVGVPISSPYLVRMKADIRLSPSSLRGGIAELNESGAGLLAVSVGEDDVSFELWRTSALSRAEWIQFHYGEDSRSALRSCYPEIWRSGDQLQMARDPLLGVEQ